MKCIHTVPCKTAHTLWNEIFMYHSSRRLYLFMKWNKKKHMVCSQDGHKTKGSPKIHILRKRIYRQGYHLYSLQTWPVYKSGQKNVIHKSAFVRRIHNSPQTMHVGAELCCGDDNGKWNELSWCLFLNFSQTSTLIKTLVDNFG